jgi:hypothetical protein
LSVAIAEKSRVKEVAVTDGTAAALLGLLELVELGVPLLPQAAIRRAALPATAVRPTFLETEYNVTTSLVSGTRRRDAPTRACARCRAGRSLLAKP